MLIDINCKERHTQNPKAIHQRKCRHITTGDVVRKACVSPWANAKGSGSGRILIHRVKTKMLLGCMGVDGFSSITERSLLPLRFMLIKLRLESYCLSVSDVWRISLEDVVWLISRLAGELPGCDLNVLLRFREVRGMIMNERMEWNGVPHLSIKI